MGLHNYLHGVSKYPKRQRRAPRAKKRPRQLFLEPLEDRTLMSVSVYGDPNWISEGPGPITGLSGALPDQNAVGAINSIAVEPTGSGYIVYVGTVNGGIWRADNISNGMFTKNPTVDPRTIVWRALTDQEPSLSISALALDPRDTSGNTLWAGTGQFSSGSIGEPTVGLPRTTDGGNTWTVMGSFQGNPDLGNVLSVLPTTLNSPSGSEVVLVASDKGLLRSADGGQTFQRVLGSDGAPLTVAATDVIADPNDPSRFYAALPGEGGVYRSDDGGGIWQLIDTGITGLVGAFDIQLAAYSGGPNTILYAAVANSSKNINGVFRSTDQTNWSSMDVPTISGGLIGLNQLVSMPMVADPTNSNVVYVSQAFRGVYSPSSGITTWSWLTGTNANGSSPHADPRGMASLNNKTLLETDDGGIYGLTNPSNVGPTDVWVGLNWSLQDTEFYRVAYDSKNGLILGGAQDNGSSVQTMTGSTQWKLLGGGDGGFVAADPVAGHYYYESNSNLYRDGTLLLNGVLPMILNPSNPDGLLVGGGQNLWESFNEGSSFTAIPPSGMKGNVTYFAYGVNNPDAAYVVTDKGELFVRSTAGNTWTAVTTTPWPSDAYLNEIVVDPQDYRIAYVLAGFNQIWLTNNAGGSWTPLTDNLDNLIGNSNPVWTIALYDPTPSSVPGDGVLLAGGFGGVYRLMPNNLNAASCSWGLYGQGLPNVLVFDLHYVPQGDLLLAGTWGRGAWIVPNASSDLSQPGRLDVEAVNSTITLRLDPANPQFIQVLVNGLVQFDGNYTALQEITINAAAGHNTIDIQNVPACVTTTINCNGPDTVNVGDTNGLKDIQGTLNVNSSLTDAVTLNLNDQPDTLGRTVTVTNESISGLAPAAINYGAFSLSNLVINGDPAGNIFNVQSTERPIIIGFPPIIYTTTTTLNTGGGNDTVNVGNTNNSSVGILGTLVVNGQGGTNTLNINDQGIGVGQHYILSSTYLLGVAAPIDFSSLANLNLNAGSGNDTLTVVATPPGAVTFSGGGGTNTLVAPNTKNTWNITATNAGNVGHVTFTSVQNLTGGTGNDTFRFSNGAGVAGTINGGGGFDTLDYSLYSTGVTVDLLTGAAPGTGGVTNVHNATGSPFNDTITGDNAGDVISGNGGQDTLTGGTGNDTFILGATQAAGTIVTGGGGSDTLVGANITNTWTITSTNRGNVNNTVTFSGTANLVGGTGNDTFKFMGAGANITGNLVGGGGTDKLDYSGNGGGAIFVNLENETASDIGGIIIQITSLAGSTATTNTLTGPDTFNNWYISGANAGKVNAFSFTGIENLIGGLGVDIFKFSATGTEVSINGGDLPRGPDDWLDYSLFTTPVTVNLAKGSATNVNGGAAGAVSGIQDVHGGNGGNTLIGDAQGNILIGGAGADTITGGTGRSLLIGDQGADRITGGSGNVATGGDILIGGSTIWDSDTNPDLVALMSILAEWQNPLHTYSQRVSFLRQGGGLNGGNKLIWGTMANSQATVMDDLAANVLAAATSGLNTPAVDWFFAGALDTTNNKESGEALNNGFVP